jgi:hypothetical protein
MIGIKRNSKDEPVTATGLRSRKSSIFTPGQETEFRLSRGRFSDFLTCPRCFYLDRVKGIVSPSTPGWTLNETTDILLKKEFDECREKQEPHRIHIENGLDHIVPYAHEDMDKWRDSLRHGLEYRVENSAILLTGGIDDIWQDTRDQSLIVVDYKSQASTVPVTTENYLSGVYRQGYKVQMDFYAYLLSKMGFKISPTSYFYVCNADRKANGFFGKLDFSETLVPYETDISWLPTKIEAMISLLNSHELPDSNESCENCAQARERAKIE